MFSKFSAPAQMHALTLDTVKRATGLNWFQVDLESPTIPNEPGVYAWVDAIAPHVLWYHGSGSSKGGGLRTRLSNQLRWRANQRERLVIDPKSVDQQTAFDTAREVPAVQQAAAGRQLHYAIAGPASWSIERNEIEPPESAVEWESFISALSLLVTGHRSLIGGGAWETKAGTIGDLMTDLAWDRLLDLQDGSWQ